MSQCMWKLGGDLEWEGHKYATKVVEESEIESALAEGWLMTWQEALSSKAEPVAAEVVQEGEPSDRELLEAEAKRLGIAFDGRTSDKKLSEKIAAAQSE